MKRASLKELKELLQNNGIKVHRDMQSLADVIDGKELIATTKKFISDENFLLWIKILGANNFSYYKDMGSEYIRFSAW